MTTQSIYMLWCKHTHTLTLINMKQLFLCVWYWFMFYDDYPVVLQWCSSHVDAKKQIKHSVSEEVRIMELTACVQVTSSVSIQNPLGLLVFAAHYGHKKTP